MKRKFVLGLSALLCVTLIGCGETTPTSDDEFGQNNTFTPEPEPSATEQPTNQPLIGDILSIHYYRYDQSYDSWALWLWETGKDGKEFAFNGSDDYGAVATYALSEWTDVVNNGLGFIVKTKGSWDAKDVENDRFIDFSNLTKDNNDTYHIYLKTGDPSIYTAPDAVATEDIISASFINQTEISFVTSGAISSYTIYENDQVIETVNVTSNETDFTYTLNKEANLTSSYKVEVTYATSESVRIKDVEINSLYSTDAFDSQFTYDGDDLGVTYTSTKSTFKVWSPVAKSIKLKVYSNGTPTSVDKEKGDDAVYIEKEMVLGEKGVWSTDVEEDLEGKYYTYTVTNSKYTNFEIVDPYAKSAGVNGQRGMIVDFSKTNPEGWDSISAHQYDKKSLVVYETHVSDISSSSTWSANEEHASASKKYKGAYLEGTTYTKDGKTVTTGFDHIKELGVNAVQFVPIYDQANDETNLTFNWGYNPLNYNVLEGGYSSDPHDGYARIKEFKELVKAYNEAGINVIMDVVYNHISGAVGSNFDVLVPGYYYRYSGGKLSNGSGCGNETASEMPMFRKFMKDSTKFWATEYKLGGFRFDLMALHDIETMNQVTSDLLEINPSIAVYGEPWTGGTSPLNGYDSASQVNASRFEGYGQFNDQMRDALIKGGLSGASEKGWVNNSSATTSANLKQIAGGIKGNTTNSTGSAMADADKTVNYVTCHDNYTLYDRMIAAGESNEEIAKKQAMLANSVVLTSQGTTFILAGEEFFRTKGGDHNSYESSYEVNELNYELKVDNYKAFENYQKLIQLKTTVDGLHLPKASANKISVNVTANQIVFDIVDTANNKVYRIVHNNGYKTDELATVDMSGFDLYLNTDLDGNNIELSANTTFNAYQTIIGVKSLG